jgi:cytochrome c2
MRNIILSMLLFLAVAVLVSANIRERYFPADPLNGASLFSEKGCDRCHAIEGHGGVFGPDLASSDFNRSLLDIVSLMWNHSTEMINMMNDLRVASPELSGDQLSEITAYLFYLDYFDKPGDIAEGKRVFSRKGCDNCHQVAGIGIRIGPDLSHIRKYVSPIFLAQEMWNHGPRIKRKMDDLNVSWPKFNGEEISNLLAFLRDASQDTTSVRIFMRPGNPQVGEKLFTAKRCSTCHRINNTGNMIGPDLTQSEFHKSVTSVAAMMWNHGPSIWEAMKENNVRTPTFENNEMADCLSIFPAFSGRRC